MNRNAGHLTTGIQTGHDLIITIGILRDRLTMNIGGYTAHHIVTRRNDRNRLLHWIGMRKSSGQLANTWQTAFKHFFAQVIELQEYMVTLWTASAPLQDFKNHRAGHDVSPRKVFGIGRVALHETLTIFID